VALLDTLDSWIELVPPKSDPQRYGNLAFRDYIKLFEQRANEVLEQLLPSTLHPAIQEISPYLTQSMGHGTRIDYGSGHELSFVVWLCCLEMIGFLQYSDHPAVVLRVFVRYLELVRKLQRTYQLEPAGSHGVWGLDDYQFLPYLWGSAQLRDHARLKPIAVMDAQQVEDYAPDYMYFGAIQSIHQVCVCVCARRGADMDSRRRTLFFFFFFFFLTVELNRGAVLPFPFLLLALRQSVDLSMNIHQCCSRSQECLIGPRSTRA